MISFHPYFDENWRRFIVSNVCINTNESKSQGPVFLLFLEPLSSSVKEDL